MIYDDSDGLDPSERYHAEPGGIPLDGTTPRERALRALRDRVRRGDGGAHYLFERAVERTDELAQRRAQRGAALEGRMADGTPADHTRPDPVPPRVMPVDLGALFQRLDRERRLDRALGRRSEARARSIRRTVAAIHAHPAYHPGDDAA